MDQAVEAMRQTNFSRLDWVLIIVYPTMSLFIGLFVRKFVKNMNDFVCAGRGLGTALGVATMTGTELGLITVMYSAQKGFSGGFAAFHIALIACIVTFVVGATGFFVYRLRELRVLTIPEYYERRFDRKTRILGGIMMALGGILNMGLFLKVGSMFIVGVTGLSANHWALPSVMVFLIVVVLIYTCLGGMISVVIADYVQFVVLSIGMLLAVFLAIRGLGWGEIWTTVAEIKGRAGFDPTVEGSGFGWEYMIWMAFTAGLVSCAIWPTAVARALAAESPKTVKKQYMWASVSFLIRFLIPYFWGICALVMIWKAPDLKALFFPGEEAVAAGAEPMSNLYAMPIFMGRLLPAGLIGIVSAGMLAAFMSTHDSYLLCWSSVLTQDVVNPILGEKLSAKTRILLTRVFIVIIGLYVLYWGLVYKGKDDIWDYMAVTGAIYSAGAFALLLFGLYWKRASSTGAFAALLAGLSAILGLGPVKEAVGLGEFSGARIGLISVMLVVTVMVVFSLLFPDKGKATEQQA